MEHPLRCNVRECRREVGQQALVTTCSHIFCVECAARHGLSGPDSDRQRKCPACRTGLQGPDDAILANLNLNEDYKTSVLSGLSPTVIMECTGRALSFWAYQTSQEDVFQRQTVKKMTAQLKTMERRHQSAISEVIEEKETLQERFQAQILDYSDLRRKYEELGKLYKDKCRRLNQVQDLYDKVKQRVEMGQVEAAASDAVDFQLLGPGPNTTQGLCEHQQEPTYLDPQRHAGPIRVYGRYGSIASREEEPWSRPGPTSVGIPQTPRGASQGQSFDSGRGYRLSTTSRLPAETPLTRGFSNLHAGYTAQRNPSSARSRGLGVGLSAGIRASQTGNGPAEPRETTPHHKVASRPVLVPSAFGPLTSM